MNTIVFIKFDLPPLQDTGQQGSPGTEARIPVLVRRSAGATKREGNDTQTVMVPLRNNSAKISLELGTYYLRATLPNGARVSDTVEVTEQPLPQTITLKTAYNASVDNHSWFSIIYESRRKLSRQADLLKNPSSITLGRGSLIDNTVTSCDALVCRGAVEKIDFKLKSSTNSDDCEAMLWLERHSKWEPAAAEGWSVQQQSFNQIDTLIQWKGEIESTKRIWLEVFHPGHSSKFALLPPSATGQEARVFLKLDRIDKYDNDPINIIPEFSNEEAAVLLAYMHRCDTISAVAVGATLIDQAQNLLAGKYNDFTSAAIAAYYMHQYGPSGKEVPAWWLSWLVNLDEQFPAYADGAVIRAWQFLHRGEARHAAERFIAAAGRGLPLFTRGVRLLLDGLELLAISDFASRMLQTALSHVRRQASTIDWTEATTTRWGRVRASCFVSVRCGEEWVSSTASERKSDNVKVVSVSSISSEDSKDGDGIDITENGEGDTVKGETETLY